MSKIKQDRVREVVGHTTPRIPYLAFLSMFTFNIKRTTAQQTWQPNATQKLVYYNWKIVKVALFHPP